MSVKDALHAAIDGMSETDATTLLWTLRGEHPRPFPTWDVLATYSESELQEIFDRFPPETDLDELEEWERGTGADIALIDD